MTEGEAPPAATAARPPTGVPEAVVHIGLPRAGSTAFQQVLDLARPWLSTVGVSVLGNTGSLFPGTPRSLAVDLANAVLRLDVDAPLRLHEPDLLTRRALDASEAAVREHARSDAPVLVASVELLSWVATRAEIERLVELLAPRTVRVVVVRRNVPDHLEAVRRLLVILGLDPVTEDPTSGRNIGPDGHFGRQDELVGRWVEVLGRTAVTEVDYDAEVAAQRTVVPALWRACGLPEPADADELFGRPWTNLMPGKALSPAAILGPADRARSWSAARRARRWARRPDLDTCTDPEVLRAEARWARDRLDQLLDARVVRFVGPVLGLPGQLRGVLRRARR